MQEVWPGRPSPLGATWDGSGVNFALYSENAESVELWRAGAELEVDAEACALRANVDGPVVDLLDGVG